MKKLPFLLGAMLMFSFFYCKSIGQSFKSSEQEFQLSDYTASFVSLHQPKLALINVKLIDGNANSPKERQSVLIEHGVIVALGPSDSLEVPPNFYRLDLTNKSLIPGLVGTHNHMRMHLGALLSTSPRLYLAAGVTTIQTCGTGNPAEELAIAKSIEIGEQPGPRIINSGPYFTGPEGKPHFIRVTDGNEDAIRNKIAYWAELGVKWLKVYRHTRPQDLAIILDEAHKHGLKVAGHLCATTYKEAADLGIDAIEHGFVESYDHSKGKIPNSCSGSRDFRNQIEVSSEAVKELQQYMIEQGVALGSTLSCFEALPPDSEADPRDLELMSSRHLAAYHNRQERKKEQGEDWWFKQTWYDKSVQYDYQFFQMGGLLVSGSDPETHNLPGYGDQKNYEIFIKAGFKPEEAIQVMTANGAKLLELEEVGSIQKGKIADLVVLDGDLEKDPSVIRKVEFVFKNGIAYDPNKLIASLKGSLGTEHDDSMIYFGQKPPGEKAEIFAADLISKADRYEFGCSFSKDGKEFFFGVDNGKKNEIFQSKLINGVWTSPISLFQADNFSYNDPMLSPDENRLYFISNRPLTPSGETKDIDIWYIEREGDAWSAPINLGPQINSSLNEYFVSFTDEGTIYFASRDKAEDAPRYAYDIYRAPIKNGQYMKPEKLPETINTKWYEADVCVAPDESFIIFCASWKEGKGQGDLYISFRDEEGNWSASKNIEEINTEGHELCPFLSKDGKYLFFTSKKDLYWISTSILEVYKEKSE